MYPPHLGEATQQLKGALSQHTHTHSPPHPDNEPVSLTHPRTRRATHTRRMHTMYKHRSRAPPVRREGEG